MQNSFGSNEMHAEEICAGFWVRLAAWMIDSVIVFFALLLVRFLLLAVMALADGTWISGDILFHYDLKDIILYLLKVAYFILLTYYTGSTFGKKVMNLQVVNADGSANLSIFTVIYRETVGKFLSSVILCIGYLMIGIQKEKRGLHDMLCDTKVIYAKKIKVYSAGERNTLRPEEKSGMNVQKTASQVHAWSAAENRESEIKKSESIASATGYRLVQKDEIKQGDSMTSVTRSVVESTAENDADDNARSDIENDAERDS